jgi:hypothetical protein
MCGGGLITIAGTALRQTMAGTPAQVLLAHVGLETRATAEVQDLYSQPISVTEVVPLVTGEHAVPRAPTVRAA